MKSVLVYLLRMKMNHLGSNELKRLPALLVTVVDTLVRSFSQQLNVFVKNSIEVMPNHADSFKNFTIISLKS